MSRPTWASSMRQAYKESGTQTGSMGSVRGRDLRAVPTPPDRMPANLCGASMKSAGPDRGPGRRLLLAPLVRAGRSARRLARLPPPPPRSRGEDHRVRSAHRRRAANPSAPPLGAIPVFVCLELAEHIRKHPPGKPDGLVFTAPASATPEPLSPSLPEPTRSPRPRSTRPQIDPHDGTSLRLAVRRSGSGDLRVSRGHAGGGSPSRNGSDPGPMCPKCALDGDRGGAP